MIRIGTKVAEQRVLWTGERVCGVLCQDNNPGTRNLELGHTIIKMKCAASRVIEDSDDVRSVEDSELGSRTKGDGKRGEIRRNTRREMGCGQHARDDVTCKTLRRLKTGEMIDNRCTNKSAMCWYVCMCVGTYLCYCLCGRGRLLGGCILGRVTSREQDKHVLLVLCASVCVSLYL